MVSQCKCKTGVWLGREAKEFKRRSALGYGMSMMYCMDLMASEELYNRLTGPANGNKSLEIKLLNINS